MDKNKQLYFVALVPPEPILFEVMQMKEEVAERFHSKAALRSPAHITLHMPFQYREDREEILLNAIEDQIRGHKKFRVDHEGFGYFEPRVVFVNVKLSDQLVSLRNGVVKCLRLSANIFNADYKNKGFHPHMTIAFRDLKKSIFPEVWAEFQTRTYKRNWMCGKICLLKHTGKEWLVHKEIGFLN